MPTKKHSKINSLAEPKPKHSVEQSIVVEQAPPKHSIEQSVCGVDAYSSVESSVEAPPNLLIVLENSL